MEADDSPSEHFSSERSSHSRSDTVRAADNGLNDSLAPINMPSQVLESKSVKLSDTSEVSVSATPSSSQSDHAGRLKLADSTKNLTAGDGSLKSYGMKTELAEALKRQQSSLNIVPKKKKGVEQTNKVLGG